MKQQVEEMGTAARPRAGGEMSEADKQEMLKKMEAAGTPGPAHKALDAMVGNWKAEVKRWIPGGGEAHESEGSAKTSWALNGRFLEKEFKGDMFGKPYTARGFIGYDNVKQAFNSVWVSDIETSMFACEGKGDSGNKVITLEGKSSCAATGQKEVPIKLVYRSISPDKHVFEFYDKRTGKDEKRMEITYTRK